MQMLKSVASRFVTTKLLMLGVFTAPAFAEPKVTVSIKPLHSLVAGVMDGVGTPELLIPGNPSPHAYTLKPSAARKIQDSDVIFWIGKDLETVLEKPLNTISNSDRLLSLFDAEGILKLAYAEDDHKHEEHAEHEHDDDHKHEEHAEHKHDDDHKHEEHAEHKHDDDHKHEDHAEHKDHDHSGHEGHAHGEFDPHIWLDPKNASAMVTAIAEKLSSVDPENANIYKANSAQLKEKLDASIEEIKGRLQSVGGQKYFVFHDAYRYFENRFGLKTSGVITLNEDISPGAGHVRELRERIKDNQVVCVFSEPQFDDDLVEILIEGTDVQTAVLDPLGAGVEVGKDHYFGVLEQMTGSFMDCLKSAS